MSIHYLQAFPIKSQQQFLPFQDTSLQTVHSSLHSPTLIRSHIKTKQVTTDIRSLALFKFLKNFHIFCISCYMVPNIRLHQTDHTSYQALSVSLYTHHILCHYSSHLQCLLFSNVELFKKSNKHRL